MKRETAMRAGGGGGGDKGRSGGQEREMVNVQGDVREVKGRERKKKRRIENSEYGGERPGTFSFYV